MKKPDTRRVVGKNQKISVRTIQRIEAGTEPKGHTLRALAQALDIEEYALQDKIIISEVEIPKDETNPKEELTEVNYTSVKIINLSPVLFYFYCRLSIFLVPLLLMFTMKQKNNLVKQIVSVQIMWTVLAPVVFMLGVFLKLGRQFTLVLMILIVLSNLFIILRNAAGIDKNKRLFYRLNFNMI
ncbi:DNA-binding protein [Elizabethkingia anophelis]|nr:DNA-binding protein [Elizabethkingia anophelis]